MGPPARSCRRTSRVSPSGSMPASGSELSHSAISSGTVMMTAVEREDLIGPVIAAQADQPQPRDRRQRQLGAVFERLRRRHELGIAHVEAGQPAERVTHERPASGPLGREREML